MMLQLGYNTTVQAIWQNIPEYQTFERAIKIMANDAHSLPSTVDLEVVNKWMCARVLNLAEVMIPSSLTAGVSVAFEDFVNALGENPTAKSFIRDMQKAVGTAYSTHIKAEFGSTGVMYDEGHVYSAIIKPLFKTTIVSGAYMLGSTSLELISRWANLGGELISRSFANISIKKQAANATETNYLEFAKNNVDSALVYQAATEGVVKTLVSDSIGSAIASFGIISSLKSAIVMAESKFLGHALGAKVMLRMKDTLVDKYHMIRAHGDEDLMTSSKILTFAALVAMDVPLKIGTEIVTTYLLAPGTRIAQDGTGLAYKYLAKVWEQADAELSLNKEEQCQIDSMPYEALPEDLEVSISVLGDIYQVEEL